MPAKKKNTKSKTKKNTTKKSTPKAKSTKPKKKKVVRVVEVVEDDNQIQEEELELEKEESEEEDLSKYTVGSKKAPTQEGNTVDETDEFSEDTLQEDESKKGILSNRKNKKMMGFGLSPKLEDVIEDDIPLERRNRRLYFFGIVITAFILGATSATLYFRIQQGELGSSEVKVETEEPVEVADAEPAEEPEPTASPTPRKDITLEILNGSGISGLAGDTSDVFEGLGYTVDSVGNTEDTVGNQLYINKDLDEDSLRFLLDDVEKELDINEVTAELSDLETTARIVLGSTESSDESEE